jgi:hypothetical protein
LKLPLTTQVLSDLNRIEGLIMDIATETQPDSESLVFTARAAHKVRELIVEEGNVDLSLRVAISGGGCSGFQLALVSKKKSPKTTPKSPLMVCVCW